MTQPPYNDFPTIATGNIVLRQILPTDLDDIVEISYYDGVQATTAANALEMLNKINADYQNGDSIHWGIADAANNTIVGTCGYYRGFANGTGELGCILRPAFRSQGFMTQAMRAAAEFGLNHIGLQRVIAITDKQNIKAIQLLERLQFVKTAEPENGLVEYEYSNNKSL